MDDIRISLDTTGAGGEVTLVRVDGVIDTMTASELERVMNSLLEQKKYKIIIDLAGVDYISSAGWGIFISNIREIKANSGDIKLARMIPSVYEIFELLEFDSILKAYDNIEKAKIEFRGGSADVAPEDVRQHNQKEAEHIAVARQVEVATADEPAPLSRPDLESTRPIRPPEARPNPASLRSTQSSAAANPAQVAATMPEQSTTEKLVLSLIKADPFYSISELKRMVNSELNGAGQMVGWWTIWNILRRNSLLSKKSRFRFSRR